MSNAGRVLLGVITGAHGVRGAVRLKSFTGTPEAIAAYGAVGLGDSGREAVIRTLRPAGEDFIAVLDGVTDRNAAEALKGCHLHVARDRLPAPAADEVYVSDMIGLQVYLRDGSLLGEVAAVMDFGAGPGYLTEKLLHRSRSSVRWCPRSMWRSAGSWWTRPRG